MATIADVVSQLKDVGIFEFFLPFILIFTVVFAMLQKTGIFGDKKDPQITKINAIIAFVFGLFIMVYPTTSLYVFSLTDFLGELVGGFLIYVMGIIIFMIVMFMIATPLNKGNEPSTSKAGTIGAVAAIILVVALFLSSSGNLILPGVPIGLNLPPVAFGGIDPGIIAVVLVLGLMVAAIWWITKT